MNDWVRKPRGGVCNTVKMVKPHDQPINGRVPGSIEEEFGVPIPGRILPPDQWTQTAIKQFPSAGPIDWTVLFGREAPVVLDLGCGNGRFLIGSALERPELNHLGIDVLPVVIRYARRRGNQRGLRNLKFAVGGAFEFLRDLVAPSSVREIHCYHPQPYIKPHLASRRLIQPHFLFYVHRSLEPGGLFVIQTDHPDYWSYMQQIVRYFFEFHEQNGPWPNHPEGRTRREIIARKQGLTVYRGYGRALAGLKREEALSAALRSPMPRFRADRRLRLTDQLERE